MSGGIREKLRVLCKSLYATFVKGSPPEPCEEVQELLADLCVPKRQQLMMYQVFHELRQGEMEEIIRTAVYVRRDSVYELVLDRRRWCEDLLKALLTLGGCEDEDEVSWDSFLYILLRFCSLSKVELCQALFLMIVTKVDSRVRHYLTMHQLIEFYSVYAKCPVTSFNTRAIDFSRLPLRRYYVDDFVQLVQRFTVLLNPTIHLQRSLQEFLPSVEFWDNHHRSEVIIRKITFDFFQMEKTACFLWGEPPFRESCDMLAPEALGFQACNSDQWDLRTFDLHERIGAISDAGSFSRDGKFTAPPGFQYRSLKQFSIWGEQPSPEETELMMLQDNSNVYLSAAGYITKHIDHLEEEDQSKDEKDKDKGEKKKKKKAKQLSGLALEVEELDPLTDPTSACLRGACLDETFNPPPTDMPPPWMKRTAIAPAPRILAADPPLRDYRDVGGTQSAFWNSKSSFGMNQSGGPMGRSMNSFGKSQLGDSMASFGQSQGQSPTSKRGGGQVKFSDM